MISKSVKSIIILYSFKSSFSTHSQPFQKCAFLNRISHVNFPQNCPSPINLSTRNPSYSPSQYTRQHTSLRIPPSPVNFHETTPRLTASSVIHFPRGVRRSLEREHASLLFTHLSPPPRGLKHVSLVKDDERARDFSLFFADLCGRVLCGARRKCEK